MKTAFERSEKTSPLPAQQGRENRDTGRNRGKESWARVSAMAGAGVWAGLAVLARMGAARIGALELMFLLAPLVIVPLGMELESRIGGSSGLVEVARWMQPAGAICTAAAMWLPPGRKAGVVAAGWLIVCGLMAFAGVVELGRLTQAEIPLLAKEARSGASHVVLPGPDPGGGGFDFRSGQVRAAVAIARIDLAVGGAWLVASRLGMRPLGIQEPIGLLTAVHFHFAGFATATIAAATLRFAERRARQRWLRRVVGLVCCLPYVVAVGFVISMALKMGAAIAFSASVAALAIFLREQAKQAQERTARALLYVASGAVFAGMVLAGAYAVADFLGSDALTIPQMVRTHGILNAVGFCLPALLGWRVEGDGRTCQGGL